MSLKIHEKISFGHFFVFLALCSVIYWPVQLFNTSCGWKEVTKKDLIKKLIGTVVYFNGTCFLKKRKNLSLNSHFLPLPKL